MLDLTCMCMHVSTLEILYFCIYNHDDVYKRNQTDEKAQMHMILYRYCSVHLII